MIKRTVVIKRKSFCWQPKIKRKIQPLAMVKSQSAGFINPVFIVFACTVFSGLFYIYSVNQTAVKGIQIRNVEKEVANKQKDNETLKIKEAELKSLYNIEEQSKYLNMIDSSNVKYIKENTTVAFDSSVKKQ
jgi:hypothetical protein